ncbi:MAG: AI-2E family transporter [Gemmatimonadota bacterium]|nr:AI-2E family transporter [Gemmatimonadota bacterium]
MSETHAEGRDRFGRTFLLLLTVGITILFLTMIRSMLVALLMAGIFAALFQPLHRRLLRAFGGRRNLASLVSVLVALLLVVVPLSGFAGIVASQAIDVTRSVGPWIEQQVAEPDRLDELLSRVPLLDRLRPFQGQISAKLAEVAGNVGSLVVRSMAGVTRGTAAFLLNLFVMLYAMFFFLGSGDDLLRRILHYVPLESSDEARMVEKFVSVTRATIKGSLVIGIVQGVLAGAAFAVVGIRGAAFWGTVMAVLSIIPAVGSGLVWAPAVVYLFATGDTTAAIGLGIWCLVVVGTVDNFLRPALVGRDTRMPDLLVLVSTLGGLFLFGAVGFIIGPVVAALFVTIWEIYGRVFAPWLPGDPVPAGAAVPAAPPPSPPPSAASPSAAPSPPPRSGPAGAGPGAPKSTSGGSGESPGGGPAATEGRDEP